jgi:hypothetical protein
MENAVGANVIGKNVAGTNFAEKIFQMFLQQILEQP